MPLYARIFDPEVRNKAYDLVKPLVAPELPAQFAGLKSSAGGEGRFVRIELPRKGTLTLADRAAHISTPGPVVYAPDFAVTQRPFVRVSFGIEHRVAEAATRLRQACAETFAMM